MRKSNHFHRKQQYPDLMAWQWFVLHFFFHNVIRASIIIIYHRQTRRRKPNDGNECKHLISSHFNIIIIIEKKNGVGNWMETSSVMHHNVIWFTAIIPIVCIAMETGDVLLIVRCSISLIRTLRKQMNAYGMDFLFMFLNMNETNSWNINFCTLFHFLLNAQRAFIMTLMQSKLKMVS